MQRLHYHRTARHERISVRSGNSREVLDDVSGRAPLRRWRRQGFDTGHVKFFDQSAYGESSVTRMIKADIECDIMADSGKKQMCILYS
jgi:hypothetical protein